MFYIDQDRCTNCGQCVKVCPAGVFRPGTDGTPEVGKDGCLNCFHCAAACPSGAIIHDRLGRETCLPLPPDDGSLLARLQRRRSIRHFKPDAPDRAVIQAALDGAAYGPSAKNHRAYQWTVILGRTAVEGIRQVILDWAASAPDFRHLVELARRGSDPLTCGAPCLILVHCPDSCANPAADSFIAATLAEQLLNDAGLGTCWGGYFQRTAAQCPPVKEALALPEGHKIYAVLMVGFPDEDYRRIPVRPKAEINWLT